jgi:hypothetical protein
VIDAQSFLGCPAADGTAATLSGQHFVVLIKCNSVFPSQHPVTVTIRVFDIPLPRALDLNLADRAVLLSVARLCASFANANEAIWSAAIDVEFFKRFGDFAAVAGFNDWIRHCCLV